MSGIGVICAGQAVVLLTGEFDISVGSIVGFCGMLVALLTKNFEHYILMVFVGLGTGALIGFSNGLLITKGRVPALIQTFSYLSIFQGATFLLSNGYAVGVNQDAFRFLGTTRVFSIPLPIIILVLIYTVFHIVLKYTKFGRYIYSVGGNIEAARLSGINVDRVKILAYVISGTLSAFGGIMLASRLGSAQTLAGSQYPLNSIAACVLGGVSIGGGVGAIFGALIGVAIVAILKSGLIMIDMPSYWQWIAIGVVLITAVYFDVRRKEK
jgi:ribose transport system permease protein